MPTAAIELKGKQESQSLLPGHACSECGHMVYFLTMGDEQITVEHLPDGRHQWSYICDCGIHI